MEMDFDKNIECEENIFFMDHWLGLTYVHIYSPFFRGLKLLLGVYLWKVSWPVDLGTEIDLVLWSDEGDR